MFCSILSINDEKKFLFFALGRNSMYAACRVFDLQEGDEVLTPAFDCDSALQPFKVLGYKMQFFRSDPYTFSADINDLKNRINKNTKLIHIINHFGFPQPWDDLLELSRSVGIPILEDNAYSLFSEFKNRPFGSFGDISIFSLRKNLSLIDGGLLCLNNLKYKLDLPLKKAHWVYPNESYKILGGFKRRLTLCKGFGFLRYKPFPPLYSDKEDGFPLCVLRDCIGKEFSCDYLRPMSRYAHWQLNKFSQQDYIDICDKKIHYYHYLSAKLTDMKGIKILWPELPPGVVPFCFSFLVESHRDIFLEKLRKNYDVMAWPTLSSLVLRQLQDFPEVVLLGRKLLQINLPADKIMSPGFTRHLENLVNDMHKLCEKYL